MFLKQGDGNLISWSVFSVETRVVREHGQAGSIQDCLIQAGEGEDVFIGQALPAGTIIAIDGTITAPAVVPKVHTVADVKAEAGRRLKYTDWYVTRAAEDPDKPIPEDVAAERAWIRQRSSELEAMSPIPDPRDPKQWVKL